MPDAQVGRSRSRSRSPSPPSKPPVDRHRSRSRSPRHTPRGCEDGLKKRRTSPPPQRRTYSPPAKGKGGWKNRPGQDRRRRRYEDKYGPYRGDGGGRGKGDRRRDWEKNREKEWDKTRNHATPEDVINWAVKDAVAQAAVELRQQLAGPIVGHSGMGHIGPPPCNGPHQMGQMGQMGPMGPFPSCHYMGQTGPLQMSASFPMGQNGPQHYIGPNQMGQMGQVAQWSGHGHDQCRQGFTSLAPSWQGPGSNGAGMFSAPQTWPPSQAIAPGNVQWPAGLLVASNNFCCAPHPVETPLSHSNVFYSMGLSLTGQQQFPPPPGWHNILHGKDQPHASQS